MDDARPGRPRRPGRGERPGGAGSGWPAGLVTPGGVEVTAWWHDASGPARGAAVLAPGVAVPARVLLPLADALTSRAWDVLRLEFPGVGASSVRPRDSREGMAAWGAGHLDTAVRAARERARTGPVVVVGHSAGAWLLLLTPAAPEVDAVLAIASMSGSWRLLRRRARPRLLLAFWVVIPLMDALTGTLPGWVGLGVDAPGAALRQWARWCRRPGFVYDDPDVTTHEQLLSAPVRVLLPTDDAWATRAAVDAMWGPAAGGHETVPVRPEDHGGAPIGHTGLLRSRFAESVWSTQLEWLATAAEGHAAAR